MRIETSGSFVSALIGRRTGRLMVWAEDHDDPPRILARVVQEMASGSEASLVLFDRSEAFRNALASLGLLSDEEMPQELSVEANELAEILPQLAPFSLGVRMTKRSSPPFHVLAVLSLYDDNFELESATDPDALHGLAEGIVRDVATRLDGGR